MGVSVIGIRNMRSHKQRAALFLEFLDLSVDQLRGDAQLFSQAVPAEKLCAPAVDEFLMGADFIVGQFAAAPHAGAHDLFPSARLGRNAPRGAFITQAFIFSQPPSRGRRRSRKHPDPC